MQSSIIDVFRAIATALPDRECLVHRATRHTYATVHDRAERLASLLAGRGLGAHRERPRLGPCESGQDHLALYLHNCPAYFEATLGALAARLAPLSVNYRYTAAELRHLFGDARPAVIVYHATFAPVIAEVLPQLPTTPLLLQVEDGSGHPLLPGALDYDRALDETPRDPTPPDASPDDLFLLYTGGTTGMPKGTMWRNGDLMRNLAGILYPPDASPAEAATAVAAAVGPHYLGTAPFMHATGWVGALRTLLLGGVVVIPDAPHRLDPPDVCALIEREQIDTASLVGEAFCRPIADELDRRTYDMSSLRAVLLSGGATQPRTLERLAAHMHQTVFSDAAGSSEIMQVVRTEIPIGATREAGVFSMLPRGRVVDQARTRLLGPGEEGIGWLAGAEPLPLGYLGDEAKTAETFQTVDGQRLGIPGDLVRLRADGTLVLLGRDSMTINTGGEKVFAEEVERAVFTHPAVLDVLVVGRPSERWGSEVVALIRLDGAAGLPDDEELRARAGEQIARYKLPKAFLQVPEIRRNPAGKADYAWARALAAEASEESCLPSHTSAATRP
ncbi:AMP-binding protein [Streptomyces albipurpureus]|uniref:AMP-binding protein n=1 Tax=Streptomyces albipurpureus TaxID=2897419 RepID=A0ABT0UZ98_9ACTN|nr:AMP-binding protein [Streptomyces sp. CWNU-1]MCM2393425.1 AMP-binding protein [Streptomyces sp. CWNU-1]